MNLNNLWFILIEKDKVMKYILMILVVGMLCACRTLTPEQQAEKQEREAMQQKLDSAGFVLAGRAVEDMNFILEADKVVFKRGTRAFVNASKNFIFVKDGKAVVQVAPFSGGGPNGVGGITVEGTPSNFSSKTDRSGNMIYSFNINGVNISASVIITLLKNSDKAIANVNPNFNSNNVTLEGRIVPPDDSNVVQGLTY